MAGLRVRFAARCAGDLTRLRELVAAGRIDSDDGRALAHSLAGAGATFGFPDVSTAAGRLDDAHAEGRTPSAAEVAALIAALDAVVTPAS
jgi:HPt (histidine-containing phosphotransfer) domain-containing protein